MSEAGDELLEASLRAGRPPGPSSDSLERRLAIASILAASGAVGALPRLGRLQVRSRIGGGGMGVVYRAHDPKLERDVAVKLLRGSTPPERRALIAREARALAKLNHPHVVAVHDIVHDERELYFVMEYVPGMTLRAWLDAHPDASYRDVLRWFLQAGRGLRAAHEAGVVHGDFKPENVLVGEDGRARVLDFGLSRRSDDDSGGALLAGTPYYMAPEVRAGRGASAQSDQFSFCRALAEALSARGHPAALASAIERGLAQDPSERHADLGALLEALTLSEASVVGRPRALLLERVARLWLNGVLDRSLAASEALDLKLAPAPKLVEAPWQGWGVAAGPAQPARVQTLEHVLTECGQSLLIVGPPGSGKTTAMLLLCRALWRHASSDAEAQVPVVLSLSTYEPEARDGRSLGEHFAQFLVDELVTKYGLARPSVPKLLDEAAVVLLLDGLDETDPCRRRRVVETLNRFRIDRPLPMVVTCRDSEYEALQPPLSFGGAVRVEPLEDGDIERLARAREARVLLDQLRRDPRLREQLRNPLMLTLCASGEGPQTPADFCGWARVYGMYVEHALAQAPEDERARLLEQLGFLARTMRRHNTSDLWLERLHFGWLARRWERVLGYALAVLSVLAFGIGLNLAQVPLTGDPLPSALIFGSGVSLSSFAYTRGRIVPVEFLRWSWRRALRLLPVTTVCASLVGLAEALRVNFASNMVGAALTGAILALVFALEPSDRPGRVRVNEGIRSSLGTALRVSFGLGVPVGLLFGLVFSPLVIWPLVVDPENIAQPHLVVGVAVGLFVFTALFLIYGGFTVLMHWVLRVWIAARTPLPLALEGMLERATDLGLMRRVGGGYVFLHRTLLDHFADRADPRERAAGSG